MKEKAKQKEARREAKRTGEGGGGGPPIAWDELVVASDGGPEAAREAEAEAKAKREAEAAAAASPQPQRHVPQANVGSAAPSTTGTRDSGGGRRR